MTPSDIAKLNAAVLAIESLEGVRLPRKIGSILNLTHDTLVGFILGVRQARPDPDTQHEEATTPEVAA